LKALSDALEGVLNYNCEHESERLGQRLPSNCEVLAAYLNNVMCGKVGSTKLSPGDVDRAWHKAVGLFPFLKDKDLFMEAYRYGHA